MSTRNPLVDLLLRGDVLAQSPLAYADLRARMLAALNAQDPRYTQRAATDPGVALIEALAATMEVMAFYHDRFLTESKLESAILLESVAWLAQVVGFSPTPSIAAVSYQLFEAASSGLVLAGTQVSGSAGDPPVDVVFETLRALSISPALNQMELSPILTLAPKALRAVIRFFRDPTFVHAPKAGPASSQKRRAVLPPDDFIPGAWAMIRTLLAPFELELSRVETSRMRAVAFERPLFRSYAAQNTLLLRATRIRHLRFGFPLGDDDAELYLFELTREPILHIPDASDTQTLQSTLELFVFDDPNETIGDPTSWDPANAWEEVPDFSNSQASDRHYRTFIDDRLRTYILLRRKLGYRTLLSDEALSRVYARFVPAFGRMSRKRTLRLDARYYKSSIIRPSVAGKATESSTTWLITEVDTGFQAGEQIAILGAKSGTTHFRTLTEVDGQQLSWARLHDDPKPKKEALHAAHAHEPIQDTFVVDQTQVAPLDEIAAGQLYPLWADFYRQARIPLDITLSTGANKAPLHHLLGGSGSQSSTKCELIAQQGMLFLLVEDSSHIKLGDYLLIGMRLTEAYRSTAPPQPTFNPQAPWICAEVVQAIEVQGNLVRLKNPLSHDYGVISLEDPASDSSSLVTEVIVVPAVASVYYGDSFEEQLKLNAARTFATMPTPSVQVPSFVTVALDSPLDGNAIFTELGSPSNAAAGWSNLFFAISGETQAIQTPQWTASVSVADRKLQPTYVASLKRNTTTISATPFRANAGANDTICVDLDPSKAADVLSSPSGLVMVMKLDPDLLWMPMQTDPPAPGKFYVVGTSGSEFKPPPQPALNQAMLGSGGTLVISKAQQPPTVSSFNWSQDGPSLFFSSAVPSLTPGQTCTVTAASASSSLDVSTGTFNADWQIPIPANVANAAWFRAQGATGQVVLERSASQVNQYIWKQLQGQLNVTAIPVQPGSALNPLTGVQTVWLLASGGLTLQNVDLWEIWEFTPSPSWSEAASFTGRVAIQQGSTKLLADASGQPSGQLRIEVKSGDTRTLFPSGSLQSVNALLADPATAYQTTPVWLLTDGTTTAVDPNQQNNPTCLHPAVALTRGAVTTIAPANGAWWWNGDALCLQNAPSAGPDTHVTTLVEYYDQGIASSNCNINPGTKTVTITPPMGFTWPDSPALPLAFLVVTKSNSTAAIYHITSRLSVPQANTRLTLTLDQLESDASSTWQEVYFVRRDLLTSKRTTITPSNGISVTMASWIAPSSDVTVGLQFAKAGAPTSYVPTRMFYDSGTKEFLLIPRNGNIFPSLPAFDSIYLSVMAWTSHGGSLTDAHAAVRIAPASLPPGIHQSDITHLVLGNMPPAPWAPTQVAPSSPQGVLDLDQTLSQLFSTSLPPSVNARLVLASFGVTANDRSQVVGTGLTLTMSGSPSPDWLVKGGASTTTALVFHNLEKTKAAISKQWQSLAAASPPPWMLSLPDLAAELIFDAQSTLECTELAAAQDWSNVTDAAFTHEPLRIELGPIPSGATLDLQPGDCLLLDSKVQANITHVETGGSKPIYELDYAAYDAPKTIALSSVNTTVGPDPFSAKLDLSPISGGAPWLFTFDENASIKDNLLIPEAPAGGQPSNFTFVDPPSVDLIFNKIKSDAHATAWLYTNQVGKLSKDYYCSSSDPNNFLHSGNSTVNAISANNGAPFVFPDDGKHPYVFVCSTTKAPDRANVAKLGALTGARSMGSSTVSAVSQSIVFNSGNFIPVLGNGSANDYNVIVSALRVYTTNDTQNDSWVLMTYDPNLSALVQAMVLGKLQGTNGLSYTYPGPDGTPIPVTLPKSSYSFQKTADGTFTLNFLVVDLVEHKNITVKLIVQYGATPVDDTTSDAIYKFETRVLPWSPSTELIVLDSGSLKPGDLLFLQKAATSQAEQEPIQWTRIELVNGPVITVNPPLQFATVPVANEVAASEDTFALNIALPPPTQEAIDFLHYTLCGAGDAKTQFGLDVDYYTTMSKAALDPQKTPSGMRLPMQDRLVLDPSRRGARALLDSLIPGDTLLVWDERARIAWRRYRLRGEPADPTQPPQWTDFPDAQFETQVKEVDPANGLIVLTEALPESFFLDFEQDPKTKRLSPVESAVRALRVLPYYRAPFQGKRMRMAIGSGDKSRRYARYTGSIAESTGLATIPLAQEEVFASNLELLVLDPRSNDWSRWVQFDTLESAGAMNLAYVLGVDTTRSPDAHDLPFSVSFGDGKKGQLLPTGDQNIFVRSTRIGRWAKKLPKARPLRVLPPKPPHLPIPSLPPLPGMVFIDSSAQEDYCPVVGDPSFRSSLGVETVDQNHHTIIWTEDPSASPGKNTISVKGCRPGVIEVIFNTETPPALDEINAYELPDSRLWEPDEEFYAQMAADDPSQIAGAQHLQLLETEGLAPGSRLMLSRGDGSLPEIATIASLDASTYSATLEKPLANRYPLGPSHIRGNLVDILQGSSETIVLGSGDGSTINMRLPVHSINPLLFSFEEESGAEEPGIIVFVDGIPWPRVLDFAGSGPRDRVYRLDIDPDGSVFVAFGDGHRGAVPSTGIDNITATIRTGEGGSGNLAIGAINELLDGNLAVKSTSNPIASTGGYAGDDAKTARQALLNRSGQIDRVVTAGDLTRVACQLGEAIFARVDPRAPFGAVWLVVTLGDRSTPTKNTLDVLTTRLQDLLPAATGVTLKLYGATQVPVYLVVRFSTVQGYRQADVLKALLEAFSASDGGFFAASVWPIGNALRLGDVYEAIFAVPGVASPRVIWMDVHQPPNAPGAIVNETIDPGIRGVIRCDNDTLGDPRGERGTITFLPQGASTS